MTDDPPPPDMQDLARRYLDLWQDHLKAVAEDADTSETLAQTMALMSSGTQAFADAATKAASRDDADNHTDGAAPVAATSGDADARSDELARRIAALEKRVVELESELGKRRGGTDEGD
jgi:hypothetical protein